jgi:hypothetical protein
LDRDGVESMIDSATHSLTLWREQGADRWTPERCSDWLNASTGAKA